MTTLKKAVSDAYRGTNPRMKKGVDYEPQVEAFCAAFMKEIAAGLMTEPLVYELARRSFSPRDISGGEVEDTALRVLAHILCKGEGIDKKKYRPRVL